MGIHTDIRHIDTHRPEAHGNKTRPYADRRQRGYHKLSGVMKNQAHRAHALIKNVEVIDSMFYFRICCPEFVSTTP